MSDALKRLIEAVEADESPADAISSLAFDCGTQLRVYRRLVGFAYRGSLDATKELHDALLPGWNWTIRETIEGWDAMVEKPIKIATVFSVSFDHAARAWLLAILRAYQQVQA